MGDPLPMVSSSTGAMNSLLDKLTALEAQHPQLAEGVRENLKSLNDVLHSFAERRVRVRDALTNEWMLQVREVAYDMEDWIDGCLIGPSKLETDLWCSNVAEQIKEFKAQIQDAHDDSCTRYGLLSREPTCAPDAETSKVAIDPKLLYGEAPCLVAIHKPKNFLVEYLMDAEQHRKVACIVGTGGIGKTTLATEIYRQLQGQFDCGAFVYLGRNPSVKTTLISILKQVMPEWHYEKSLWSGYNYDDMGAWNEKKVVAKLWAFLKTKSYFIVLDDVRSIRTWEVISCVLPNNDKAVDRILITTCIKNVAESCCIHPSDVVHQMEGLRENDSKTLFKSKIPDSEKHSQLEVFDDMLKMCGGIPLAITVTAGLLFRKSACLPIDQYHSTPQGMRKILEISYDDLPLPVKSCFLYLSAFPGNYIIKKDRLIRRWVGEGFIPQRDEESLWETGESYFDELISRRLLQPAFDDDDDQPIGCTVHGVVVDFMESLSAEENFITAGAELKCGLPPCDSVRRVCLDYSEEDEGDTLSSSTYCFLEQNSRVASSSVKDKAISLHLSRVRSLAFSGDATRIPDLSAFKLVRVLDLKDSKGLGNEQLGSIGRLSLLRYLGLGGTDVTELPQQIMELDHLCTLDVRQTNVKRLPEFKGTKLVSLLASNLTIPRGMGEMEKLEELSTVCLDRDGSLPDYVAWFVNKLRRLRMLGVSFRFIAETERQSVEHFLQEVGKQNLQSLFLDCYPHRLLDLLHDCWTHERPHYLRKFELRIDRTFPRLPKVPQKITFLIDLTHLHIEVSEVEAQGVGALGKLPKLVLLKLYSTSGARFTVSSKDGFQCLKVFYYCCRNGDAMGVQFEVGAMPHLRRLLLDFNASKTDFVIGIQHLSCLVRVRATIYCRSTSAASEVEAAEAHIRHQFPPQPNNPELELNTKRQSLSTPHQGQPSTVKAAAAPADGSVIAIYSLEEWSIQIDEANRNNKLVVIHFTSSECIPSVGMVPFFADLSMKFPNVIFLKVDLDVDETKPIVVQFGVDGSPLFLFMKGGDVKDKLRGARKEELVRMLEWHVAQ